MQIFIRGKEGIENLGELIVTLRKRDLPFREHAVVLYEIQALLTEMRGIKKEIKSIKDEFAPFESERDVADKERTLKLLNARIDNLLFQLDRIASRRA